MAFLLALVLSFVPALGCAVVIYWLDRYEKEPKVLLGAVFLWGALVATASALVAQLALSGAVSAVTGSAKAADVMGMTLFAPLTEESLKGIAVLLVFLILRREFDSVLDGIVYASVVALGFAATEDLLYLYGESTKSGIPGLFQLFFLRIVLGIWDHPFYTAFIGIGLALSRLSRSTLIRWLAPPAGWALACTFHATHNTLAALSEKAGALAALMFLVDWGGWFAMAALIVFCIYHEGKMVARQLVEEVRFGRLTAGQYRTAISTWSQTGARMRALFAGHPGPTRRFYQVCGELAHKKEQYARLGDEGRNGKLIEELRGELAVLSPQAMA